MKVTSEGGMLTKYFEIDVPKIPGAKYIESNKTKEKFTNKLSLYYRAYDKERSPLARPVLDYPSNYTIYFDNGKVSLDKYIKEYGIHKHWAVISEHSYISSIEGFRVFSHGKFYSIEINETTKNFLESVGLENFYVRERLFKWVLHNVQVESGDELLFFIESNNPIIQCELNSYRLEVLENKAKIYTKLFSDAGVMFFTENDGIVNFTFKLKDRIEMSKFLNLKLEILYNNGINYIVSQEEVEELYNKLNKNANYYKRYLAAYFSYLRDMLNGAQKLDELPTDESGSYNMFTYGYMNDRIKNELFMEGDK